MVFPAEEEFRVIKKLGELKYPYLLLKSASLPEGYEEFPTASQSDGSLFPIYENLCVWDPSFDQKA